MLLHAVWGLSACAIDNREVGLVEASESQEGAPLILCPADQVCSPVGEASTGESSSGATSGGTDENGTDEDGTSDLESELPDPFAAVDLTDNAEPGEGSEAEPNPPEELRTCAINNGDCGEPELYKCSDNEGANSSCLLRATQVEGGEFHTCALLLDSTVQCWGDNLLGQIGDGTTTVRRSPVAVLGLSEVQSLAAGYRHTCALLSDATVECWGSNTSGQLGDATTERSLFPVPVAGLSGVQSVSAGNGHTCALLSDATVECWGSNSSGQLGSGRATGSDSLVPVAVPALSEVQSVAAGNSSTCAVLSDSTVVCWGSGLLPLGSFADAIPVEGLSAVQSVAAGENHWCALVSDGTVACWGRNSSGQLGDGTTTDRALPESIAGLGGVQSVTAGTLHSCALLSDETVHCWGRGDKLGPERTASSVPVSVVGLSGVQSVTANPNDTCAVVSDGTILCWGRTPFGQISVPPQGRGL